MKPRITLAETTPGEATHLVLQEHDSRRYLLSEGRQICGPATRASEEEIAKLAAAPFKPARQPRIWLVGVGLGKMLEAIIAELPQKRATFTVAENRPELLGWNREFFENSALDDPRVIHEHDVGPAALNRESGTLHAILVHLDGAPAGSKQQLLVNDKKWMAATFEALQPGGLFVLGSTEKMPNLMRNLKREGYEVVESTVPSSTMARKPRLLPIWLARKSRLAD